MLFACSLAIAHTEDLSAPALRDSSMEIASRIIKSKIPVLVDFWASWCMPCKMLSPILSKIEEKYRGKIKVERVNIDIHRNLAAHFGVSSIPAVFFIKGRSVVKAISGLRAQSEYETTIDEILPAEKKDPSSSSAEAQPAKSTRDVADE